MRSETTVEPGRVRFSGGPPRRYTRLPASSTAALRATEGSVPGGARSIISKMVVIAVRLASLPP